MELDDLSACAVTNVNLLEESALRLQLRKRIPNEYVAGAAFSTCVDQTKMRNYVYEECRCQRIEYEPILKNGVFSWRVSFKCGHSIHEIKQEHRRGTLIQQVGRHGLITRNHT